MSTEKEPDSTAASGSKRIGQVQVQSNGHAGVVRVTGIQSPSSQREAFPSDTISANMVLTPLSPSSSFSMSTLASGQSLISAVSLSYWDNILGPRIHHTWYAANQSPPPNTTLIHVCSQTLNGEICRDVYDSHVDFKFYTMPEKGILVTAFIFSAKNFFGLGVHSLALIIPDRELSHYLEKHELVQRWMFRLTGKLKVLLDKDEVGVALINFRAHLADFMLMLTSLQELGLPKQLDLHKTAFSTAHTMESDFIQRALASHLMTLGRSVVVGKTSDRINLMISTLALFNNPTERVSSRHVKSQSSFPYHQDLWVQGILLGSGSVLDIPAKEILCSKFPTTIINITNRQIHQSPPCNIHALRRYETLKDELVSLHYNQAEDLVFPKSMFHPADYHETYVQTLIKEIVLLHPSCGVREAYIAQFLRLLQRKALAVIKYVGAETNNGSAPVRINVKKLRHDLSLTYEGDYRIVLATAEKLKPGLYCLILGDRKQESEIAMETV